MLADSFGLASTADALRSLRAQKGSMVAACEKDSAEATILVVSSQDFRRHRLAYMRFPVLFVSSVVCLHFSLLSLASLFDWPGYPFSDGSPGGDHMTMFRTHAPTIIMMLLVVAIPSPLWTARSFEPIIALSIVLLILVYAFPWEFLSGPPAPACSDLPLGSTWPDASNTTMHQWGSADAAGVSPSVWSDVVPRLSFHEVDGSLRFSPGVSSLIASAVRESVMNRMVTDNVVFVFAVVSPMPPMITWLLLLAFNVCKYMRHSHLLTWSAHATGRCLVSDSLPSPTSIVLSMLVALVVVLVVHHFHRQVRPRSPSAAFGRLPSPTIILFCFYPYTAFYLPPSPLQSFLIKRLKDHQCAMRIDQLNAEKQRLEYATISHSTCLTQRPCTALCTQGTCHTEHALPLQSAAFCALLRSVFCCTLCSAALCSLHSPAAVRCVCPTATSALWSSKPRTASCPASRLHSRAGPRSRSAMTRPLTRRPPHSASAPPQPPWRLLTCERPPPRMERQETDVFHQGERSMTCI